MFDAALAGLTLSTLLLGLWMLRSTGGPPAAWFLLSWLACGFAVGLHAFGARSLLLTTTCFTQGTMSVALLFGGVRGLVGKPVPAWLLPGALAYGLILPLIGDLGRPGIVLALEVPVLSLMVAAGLLALRVRPPAGRAVATRVLGAVVLGVAAAALAWSGVGVVAEPPVPLPWVWPLLAILLLAGQLCAVAGYRTHGLPMRKPDPKPPVEERALRNATTDAPLSSEPSGEARGQRLRPAPDRLPEPEPEIASEEPAPTADRVLVVDDDEDVLELAGEFLRRAGYESQRAAGGIEAIDLFAGRSSDIDVVVLDLTMPDMDGREVLRELRRIRADLPVVLATGYSRGTLEQSFPTEARISFLRKPYEPEQLIDAIREARAGVAS